MKRVIENERGSTLILVLLVVLVFTVLGLSLLSGTVGEKKRTVNTESSSQAQQRALDGLTYFESKFRKDIEEKIKDCKASNSEENCTIDIPNYLDTFEPNILDNTEITAELKELSAIFNKNDVNIEVTSTGTDSSTEKTLIGYYRPKYLFYDDDVVTQISDFNDSDTIAVNFADMHLLNTGVLGSLVGLSLLNPIGNDKNFYRVPDNGSYVSVNGLQNKLLDIDLLNSLIGINIGNTGNFIAVEQKPVIATRKGSLLNADLLAKLVTANVLEYRTEADTNVLIDGGYRKGVIVLNPRDGLGGLLDWLLNITGINKLLEELGLIDLLKRLGLNLNGDLDFKDINFKKLAVMGNVIIQHSNDDNKIQRQFTFAEGLYVNKSLYIGNKEVSGIDRKLLLNGDMVAMDNLYIHRVNLNIDHETNIYVHGDATIENTCISDGDGKFRVFTKGKLTIKNTHQSCNVLDGLYYAEGGINIVTNGNKLTINGGLIGDVTIDPPEDDPEKLEINWDEEYLRGIKIKNIDLLPQGRVLE